MSHLLQTKAVQSPMAWWPSINIAPPAQEAVKSFWGPDRRWENIPWTICAMRSTILLREPLIDPVMTVVGERGIEVVSLLIGWVPIDSKHTAVIDGSLESVRRYARWASRISDNCGDSHLKGLLKAIPNMSTSQMDDLSGRVVPTCRSGFHSFSAMA